MCIKLVQQQCCGVCGIVLGTTENFDERSLCPLTIFYITTGLSIGSNNAPMALGAHFNNIRCAGIETRYQYLPIPTTFCTHNFNTTAEYIRDIVRPMRLSMIDTQMCSKYVLFALCTRCHKYRMINIKQCCIANNNNNTLNINLIEEIYCENRVHQLTPQRAEYNLLQSCIVCRRDLSKPIAKNFRKETNHFTRIQRHPRRKL